MFRRGDCYKFHVFLKKMYPQAVPYFNAYRNHVVTKIDETYYDITGEVRGTFHAMTQNEIKQAETWHFTPQNMCEICYEDR